MTRPRTRALPRSDCCCSHLVAAVLGLAGGAAAYGFIHLIGLLTNLALFHRFGWELPSFAHLKPARILVIVAAGGGFVVSLPGQVVRR